MRMSKLSEAGSHLQQAMELGEKVHGRVSRQLLPMLQLLVELKRRQRKYQEAESHCQQALGIAGAEYGPQHVEVTAWKNMLAQVGGTVLHGGRRWGRQSDSSKNGSAGIRTVAGSMRSMVVEYLVHPFSFQESLVPRCGGHFGERRQAASGFDRE